MPNNANFRFTTRRGSRAVPIIIAILCVIFISLLAYARTADLNYADAVGRTSFELCGNKTVRPLSCVAYAKDARDLMDPGFFEAAKSAGWMTLFISLVALIFAGALAAIKKLFSAK
jgi:hypothetical protein